MNAVRFRPAGVFKRAGVVFPRARYLVQGGTRIAGVPSVQAKEALNYLIPDLLDTLASLDGVSADVATSVIQLLPFGSRAVLIDLGIASKQRDGTADPHATLKLTPFAFEVMHAAALSIDADSVTDWSAKVKGDDVTRRRVRSRVPQSSAVTGEHRSSR